VKAQWKGMNNYHTEAMGPFSMIRVENNNLTSHMNLKVSSFKMTIIYSPHLFLENQVKFDEIPHDSQESREPPNMFNH